MIFWSNCLIEALKRKVKDWNKIVLIPIIHGFHFHMMWYEIDTKTIKHFTHSRLDGWFTTLWFRGTVENVKREHLEKWCKSVGIHLKV